jgi:hypothetical protein
MPVAAWKVAGRLVRAVSGDDLPVQLSVFVSNSQSDWKCLPNNHCEGYEFVE